jgi:hypothetical protein
MAYLESSNDLNLEIHDLFLMAYLESSNDLNLEIHRHEFFVLSTLAISTLLGLFVLYLLLANLFVLLAIVIFLKICSPL